MVVSAADSGFASGSAARAVASVMAKPQKITAGPKIPNGPFLLNVEHFIGLGGAPSYSDMGSGGWTGEGGSREFREFAD